MNSPAEDIKDLLVAETSLNLVFADNLFISREPDNPDNCVTLFDTPGFPPQLTFANENYEYPSLLIRIRNNSYTTGYTLAKQIFDALHGRAQETVNGTLYTVIMAMNNPAMFDFDDNKRIRFIINFNLQRR